MTVNDLPARPASGFGVQLGLLVLLAAAVPAQLYLAIPLAGPIGAAFDSDPVTATWTGSAFALAYAIGFLIFGPLSDRVGRRAVLAWGALATGAATLLVALSPSIGWLIGLRAAQGLAAASFAPVALAFVADRAPAERRQLALSALTTGLLGAGLAGQAYGQLVASAGSWRLAFWPPAIGYLAAALALWWLLPARSTPRGTGHWREVGDALLSVARTPGPVAVFVSALSVFGSFVAMYAVLDVHLSSGFGFRGPDLLRVQAIGALGLLGGVAGSWWWGSRGPWRLAVTGFGVATGGLALLPLAGTPTVLIIASVVVVAGISMVVPGLVGLLNRLVPEARGAAVAVNTFALFIGAALGQQLAALLDYRTVLAVLAVATATGGLVVGLFARPRVAVSQ